MLINVVAATAESIVVLVVPCFFVLRRSFSVWDDLIIETFALMDFPEPAIEGVFAMPGNKFVDFCLVDVSRLETLGKILLPAVVFAVDFLSLAPPVGVNHRVDGS